MVKIDLLVLKTGGVPILNWNTVHKNISSVFLWPLIIKGCFLPFSKRISVFCKTFLIVNFKTSAAVDASNHFIRPKIASYKTSTMTRKYSASEE